MHSESAAKQSRKNITNPQNFLKPEKEKEKWEEKSAKVKFKYLSASSFRREIAPKNGEEEKKSRAERENDFEEKREISRNINSKLRE